MKILDSELLLSKLNRNVKLHSQSPSATGVQTSTSSEKSVWRWVSDHFRLLGSKLSHFTIVFGSRSSGTRVSS